MQENQDPIKLFLNWWSDFKDQTKINEPSFVSLASATKDGIPSVRIVLIRHVDDDGFCFFTNLTSRKGKELIENPKAAMCFYWDEVGRQVRVEGDMKRVSEKEADIYFSNRKRGSQIGAWASKQSNIMNDPHDIVDRVKEITEQFSGQDIPRPPFWSGFRLVPNKIEFWENKDCRLHNRKLFEKYPNGWSAETLYP